MSIKNNDVVHFHYTLSEVGGETLESSRESEEQSKPMACLVGYHNILDALEAEFIDKQAGDKFSVELSPEQAYGPVIENSIQRIPIKHLLNTGQGKLKKGMMVKVNTENGPRDVRIAKVGKFNVDVDTNHPLAGRTLNFDIEIVSVREASSEEIAHRHVHGDGGHHH